MPGTSERRAIDYFVTNYNIALNPKITRVYAGPEQENPDAILALADGTKVGLEHTSAFRRAWLHTQNRFSFDDLSPIIKTMKRKFRNNYRCFGIDQVWLLVQICRTLEYNLVAEDLGTLSVPKQYEKVFLLWPVPGNDRTTTTGVLELPALNFWTSQAISA